MPTPSLFPYFLKAESGGGGPPVQTFTSEPISLDMLTANQVSISISAQAIGITLQDSPLSLDLSQASVVAQQGGDLIIQATPINLELDIKC